MAIKKIKAAFRTLFSGSTSKRPTVHPAKATVIAKGKHPIQHRHISPNVLKILKKLNAAGYDAYLVGGGVRDLLVGARPKDFDVATHASPEQIKKVFRNCRLIGKRFRLAHVFFPDEIVEVSTFRSETSKESQHQKRSEHGLITRDNVYGGIDDDAIRRDFTVNALYYTTTDDSILDFTNGMHDIAHRTIRIIGDPRVRYREDPVRMLRAIRLAAKLHFKIEPETAAPIIEMGELLEHVAKSRLFEECIKLFHNGNAAGSFELLEKHKLLQHILPPLEQLLRKNDPHLRQFLKTAFKNTDARIAEGKTISPIFLLTVLFWPMIEVKRHALKNRFDSDAAALDEAAHTVILDQLKHLSVPRRLIAGVREIIALQPALELQNHKLILSTLHDKRFRAAYDLLLLRQEITPSLAKAGDWWTDFQKANKATRHTMLHPLT